MFYGIDLHSNNFKSAALTTNSSEVVIETVSLKNSGFNQFLNKLTKDDYLVVEASTNTFWFLEQIGDRIKEVFVVDPYKFLTISNSNKKTDRVDAVKLAKKLKYYVLFDQSPEEFPTIYIPGKDVIELRSMFVTYEFIKKQVCMTKNRIRSLLRQNGILNFSGKNLSYNKVQFEIKNMDVSNSLSSQLKILLSLLNSQLLEKDNIKSEILKKGKIFYKEISLLTSIRGVSPFLAIAIMSDIADINRFKNSKRLCSYLRTTPKVDASNSKVRIGKINKQSRTLILSLMTESVKHFIDSSNKIHSFYFKKRKGKSAGKVRVAVMRKIIVTIYNMLKKEVLYYYKYCLIFIIDDSAQHDIKL